MLRAAGLWQIKRFKRALYNIVSILRRYGAILISFVGLSCASHVVGPTEIVSAPCVVEPVGR